MNLPLIIGISVGVLVLFVIFMVVVLNNYKKLTKLNATVKESYSTLEVFLNKRYELTTKIISMLEENDIKKPEIATLLNIVTQLKNNLDTLKRFSLEANLTVAIDGANKMLSSIHLDNADFVQLVLNCEYVQEDLKRARNYYNNNVETYNKMLNKFPVNISARLFKFKKEFYVK